MLPQTSEACTTSIIFLKYNIRLKEKQAEALHQGLTWDLVGGGPLRHGVVVQRGKVAVG